MTKRKLVSLTYHDVRIPGCGATRLYHDMPDDEYPQGKWWQYPHSSHGPYIPLVMKRGGPRAERILRMLPEPVPSYEDDDDD